MSKTKDNYPNKSISLKKNGIQLIRFNALWTKIVMKHQNKDKNCKQISIGIKIEKKRVKVKDQKCYFL